MISERLVVELTELFSSCSDGDPRSELEPEPVSGPMPTAWISSSSSEGLRSDMGSAVTVAPGGAATTEAAAAASGLALMIWNKWPKSL